MISNESYLMWSSDKQTKDSTSGGAFYLICKELFNEYDDFYVYGAAFNPVNKKIQHMCVSEADKLHILQGAKYVQSELGTSFREIKKLLDGNKNTVLFCGTPCQVKGLKNFLRKDYSNLYTIDLICHGVPSPTFFQKCLQYYELKNGTEYNSIKFRVKKSFSRHGYMLSLSNNETTTNILPEEDYYYTSFLNGESLRQSCYKCIFASTIRVGDLSLGDSNNEIIHPNDPVSLIIVNDEKGRYLFSKLTNCEVIKTDLNIEALTNLQLHQPAHYPQNREFFYQNVNRFSYNELQPQLSKLYKIKKIVKLLLPYQLKRKIKKFTTHIK